MKNVTKISPLVTGALILLTFQGFIASDETKTASFNTSFELTLDERVLLPRSKSELIVSLVNIDDNRCPENVQCMTAGKAIAEIKLTSKDGAEVRSKLVLDPAVNATDTIAVTLSDKKYSVILTEVNRMIVNKVKIIVRKGVI